MKRVRIDSLSNLYTLMLLYSKPCHGYEIMKNMEEKTGKKISPGQLYPFVKKLSKQGYLTTKKGSRGKKIYTLTPEGRRFVSNMLEKFDSILSIAIGSKIHKCAHCSCEIYKGWHTERVGGRKVIFCCKGCAASYR